LLASDFSNHLQKVFPSVYDLHMLNSCNVADASLHARMIFYAGDDPATGSAAGCCASWAVAHGWVASGQKALIEQGLECNRASSIFVRAERRSDQIVNVHVGGHTVEVARGELFI